MEVSAKCEVVEKDWQVGLLLEDNGKNLKKYEVRW